MEESKKKPIMIAIIVVCLILAAAIALKTGTGDSSGVEGLKRGEMIWAKCSNPDCGAEYQIDKKDYFEYVQEHQDPMAQYAPPLVCKECGEESLYRAVKCPKCEIVFFRGAVTNDFADRCPECGYSQTEEGRKKAAGPTVDNKQ